MKKFFAILLLATAFAAPALTPALAEPTHPQPETVPALQPFLKDGGKAYFMGQEAGLNGWFIIMTANRVQIAYTSLDNKYVIVGAIFGADGTNVTEQQVIDVRQKEADVNKLFTDTVEQAKKNLVKTSGMDRVLSGLDPSKKGDQLFLDLAQTINIAIGTKDGGAIYMFVDPNCPHCKHAWKDLAPLIKKYNLQVHLIPVGILGDDSIRMAGMLLDGDAAANLSKWQAYSDSGYDPDKLSGQPSEDAKAKVGLNRIIFDKLGVKATPFIAYRSKAGGVKVVTADPKDMEQVAADVAPLPAAPKQ